MSFPARAGLGLVFLLGAAAYVRRKSSAGERRRQIERGALRELRGVRAAVDGCWCYARVSSSPAARDDPPVVLVHGYGMSSAYFVPTAERLASDFNVYAPDLPDHGKSNAPPEPLDIPGFAKSLRRWMEVMQIGRACMVAHSMGCQIAVELSLRYPDAVDRVVLIGPALDSSARTIRHLVSRVWASRFHERLSLTPVILKDYLRMAGRLRHELNVMRAYRIEDKLPQLHRPALFVRGGKDRIASQAWIDELARLTPDQRVAVIPGWGHAVQYSAAAELIAVIRPFLRQSRKLRPVATQ